MRTCFLCGKNGSSDPLEKHHVFGAANRRKSEKYGLIVDLCGEECHRNGKQSAHKCKETADYLHRWGQLKWMEEQGKTAEDFRREFGRSYL